MQSVYQLKMPRYTNATLRRCSGANINVGHLFSDHIRQTKIFARGLPPSSTRHYGRRNYSTISAIPVLLQHARDRKDEAQQDFRLPIIQRILIPFIILNRWKHGPGLTQRLVFVLLTIFRNRCNPHKENREQVLHRVELLFKSDQERPSHLTLYSFPPFTRYLPI